MWDEAILRLLPSALAIYRGADAAKDCLPSCRPFPKLEGRHRPVSNEKENHWVQLGFEFQARRHQSLFVRCPDDTLTTNRPWTGSYCGPSWWYLGLCLFAQWHDLGVIIASVLLMAAIVPWASVVVTPGPRTPDVLLTILGMPTMRSELERHNDIREILDSSNAVSQTLVNTNSGDTT